MKSEISVLIADDHPVFRQGLRQIIETEAGLKVVAEAADGAAALEQMRQLKPQIAILDIHMPQMKGFDVARAVQQENLSTQIIFLTMYNDERTFNQALNLGAKGYLLKDSAISDIVASIKAVAAGQHYISAAISTYLINRSARAASLAAKTPSLQDLTPTEQRILKLIAEYKTSKEIADLLFINYRTVENHRTNICNKLGIHGSNALIKFALEHKSELS
jgi:DNA-binding NarL/FixJ family response regulator